MEETKKCPFCGETIFAIAVKCKFCHSMLDGSEKNSITEEILADKPANLFRGIEGVGGRLKITSNKLIFKSHAINIQTGITEIPINNIDRIERKNSLFIIPNQMKIILNSGVKYKFVVNGR